MRWDIILEQRCNLAERSQKTQSFQATVAPISLQCPGGRYRARRRRLGVWLKKLERAKGIEPSTYSLGSFVGFKHIKTMAAKLRLSTLNGIKYIDDGRKTGNAPRNTVVPRDIGPILM